jgi:putative membrane protein
MNTLSAYPEQFVGKKVIVQGFVYRDPTFKKQEFVVGRFAISCCVADASVSGLMAESSDTQFFRDQRWVEVEGTLATKKVQDQTLPFIKIKSYHYISAPKNPYIY